MRVGMIVLALLAANAYAVRGDEIDGSWPTFRGADRTAVADDTNLLEEWPEDGPPLQWTAEGAGRGYSSLAVADGRIFTLGDGPSTQDSADEFLSAFNADNGKLLWQLKTGEPWNNGMSNWQGSRGTPTVDDDRVYVVTPHGELIAASVQGKELWRRDLMADFGGKKADNWGYSESVLIDGDKLIVTPGGEENTMVALDKKTGELIWSTQRPGDRGAGHSSAVKSTVDGTEIYVQVTGSGPMGVRADDGKLLWAYEIDRETAVIPTPLIRDDLVFFTVGYDTGGALLRQVPAAQGFDIEEIYGLDRKLKNKHGGVVLVGDYVYGDSDAAGIPFCAELMTGQLQWKERGSGSGSASIAAADGHLYIRYQDGTMTLVKATPEEMIEVSAFKIPGSGRRPSWAHPVIVDGRLLLREGDAILCYDVRQK